RPNAIGVDGHAGIESVGPGELGIGFRPADEGADRVDRDPRGDVARLVAAHPVTHDEEPVADENAVLVPRPPPAHVRATAVLDHREAPSPRGMIANREHISQTQGSRKGTPGISGTLIFCPTLSGAFKAMRFVSAMTSQRSLSP